MESRMAKDLEKFPRNTPRMHACDTCPPEIVTLLLKKGANARATNKEGKRVNDHNIKECDSSSLVFCPELEITTEEWWPFW